MAETAAAKAGGVADNPLGTAPIPQLLFKYAPPAILSMMVTALYNIIDTFFVGHGVGEDGIAATTVAFPPVSYTHLAISEHTMSRWLLWLDELHAAEKTSA